MVRTSELAVLIAGLMISVTAAGQEAFQPSAAAEALFQEGKELVAEGRFEEACTRFEASVRIERAVGGLLNLADCHARLGRTASAWSEFQDAASGAEREGDPVRARFARRRAAELEPSLSRLAIEMIHDTPGVSIRINGRELVRDAWRSGLPVDPGRLVVEASAVGFRDWRGMVDVPPREMVVIRVPDLEPLRARQQSPRRQQASPPDRTAVYVAAGAGAAALAFGTAFGIKTLTTQAKVNERCGDRYCDATGLEWERDARTYATLSTVGLGAGVALTGLAAWLWWSKPASRGPTTSVLVDPGSVWVRGTF